MSNDVIANRIDAADEHPQPESAYTPPEVFRVASAKQLIQGPMIQPYYDCISGMTLTRPTNC